MTLTINLSSETETWLQQEAARRGQSQEQIARLALEAFSETQRGQQAGNSLALDWQTLSYRSLWEVWDNEEDAAYDQL